METGISPAIDVRALGESLSAGATLPASWYTSEAIFRQERRAIFSRSWQYACRLDEVAHPGDYLACRAGNVPVVVVRDRSHRVAAFVNVCPHRGAEIVLDGTRGNRGTLQCHYHAWTWDLDGRLRAAPGSKEQPGFRDEDVPLTSVAVAALGPFLFVNPDRQAPGWDETVGELPRILATTPCPLTALQFHERRTYDRQLVPSREADLWLVSNIPSLSGQPHRLELVQGIPFQDITTLPDPHFQRPLIGMRAFRRARLRVELDFDAAVVSIWTPDPQSPSVPPAHP